MWVYLGKKTIPLGWKLLPQIHESLFLPVSQKKRNPARLFHCMTTVTALTILMPYQCDIFYLIFNQIQHLFPLIEVWLLLDTHDIPESGLFFVLNVLMKQNLFRVNRKPWIIYNKNNFLVFLFDELVRITPSSFFIFEFLANLLNWITISFLV